MPQYSGIYTLSQASQAIKDNNWTGLPPQNVEYLIVAGGGGGAVKKNYSIAAWEKGVTPRNPSQTFAYRYIGPKLSSQIA